MREGIEGRGRGMSTSEVAAITGHNRRTVVRWVRSGQLPGVMLGKRCIKIFEADLDAFLASRVVTGGAA